MAVSTASQGGREMVAVSAEDLTPTADERAELTEQHIETKIRVFDVAKRLDVEALVLMTDWLSKQKREEKESGYYIGSRWVAVDTLIDKSEKSYKAEGAKLLSTDLYADGFDVNGAALSSLYTTIDETDSDYVREVGESYFPKSQVKVWWLQ